MKKLYHVVMAAGMCVVLSGHAMRAQETKPNIIFILADDWGYGDVKILGGDRCKIDTPHMDQLGREGMIFADAHTSSSVCTPSRYSVLTGRYNWRSAKKSGVLGGSSPPLIEEGRKTVAGFLGENGYTTACFGKWHLGMNFPSVPGKKGTDWEGTIARGPNAVGFDTYYGISASLDMPPYIWIDNNRFVGKCTTQKEWVRKGPAHKDFEAVDVLPTITEKSVRFIHANKEKPFFLYVPLNSPHTPIVPSKEWQGKSQLGAYGDFVMQTDWTVGQIVKAVDDAGLAEKTLIIVTADNGCSPAAQHADAGRIVFNEGKNEPVQRDKHYPSKDMRGHKADIFDGGHRVPFIARWTGTVAPGSVCDQTVCLVDLYATSAELLGKTVGDAEAPDSVSFAPYLRGRLDQARREATVHHSVDGSFAIRKGRWKLVMCPDSGGWSWPAPREHVKGLPAIQLYDMEADIGETTNVFKEHPEVVAELKTLLTDYVRNGRSTPGPKQSNTGPETWPQIHWIKEKK